MGLEIKRSKEGIFVSQRNYTLQLLEDTGLLATKPKHTPIDPRVGLNDKYGDEYSDQSKYRRLFGRLLYLNITRLDISFSIQRLSQFMSNPRIPHYEAAIHLLKYLKKAPRDGLFFSKESSL